jgi:hypothetical protein
MLKQHIAGLRLQCRQGCCAQLARGTAPNIGHGVDVQPAPRWRQKRDLQQSYVLEDLFGWAEAQSADG